MQYTVHLLHIVPTGEGTTAENGSSSINEHLPTPGD